MLRLFLTTLTLLLSPAVALSASTNAEFSGEKKLSCEANLCLPASARPGPCGPSVSYFYSLSAKKWKDVVKKRVDFLSKCPINDPAVSSLIQLLANGLGVCEDNYLLPRLNASALKQCDTSPCLSQIPGNCVALSSHSFTDFSLPVKILDCETRVPQKQLFDRDSGYGQYAAVLAPGEFYEGDKICHYKWISGS